MEDKFDLEVQYQFYLKKVGLTEKMMHPQQKTETKRAFFAACGQLLVLFRDDLTKLPDDAAVEKLSGMINQVAGFFITENNSMN